MQIGIWGDSITYGQCDLEGLGWVGRWRRSLSMGDVEVYNFGVCGDTSMGLLKRFVVEAESIKPDIVIFAIGINDSKKENNIFPVTFRENIKELSRLAKAHTAKIYLIGATKVNDDEIFSNDVIQEYNKALQECAKQENISFINVFDTLDTLTDLADGLHPNAQEYEKMFQAIVPAIH